MKEVYIGKSQNPWRRYKEHLRDNQVNRKTDWIKTLQKQAMHPRLEVIDRALEDKGAEKEKEWIKHYILEGWKVVNSASCGVGVSD